MSDPAVHSEPVVPDEFVPIGPPLAAGASAMVWRARHRISGHEVALKLWHQPLASTEERAQFDTESRFHQQLSGHPHIVRWLWAAAPVDAPAWMATELHGVSLSALSAKAGPLPLQLGVAIGIDLLDGLAAVHTHGVVHRDVTPANVLVQDGRAALCDLGIAVHVDALTRDAGAGTASYVAPELRSRGASAVPNFRSDVYAAARTIRGAVGEDVPDLLDALLVRAESQEPADRPADAADFRDRLREVARKLGLEHPAEDVPPPRPALRRRLLLTALAGVLAIAVVGVAISLMTGAGAGDDVPPGPAAAQVAPADIDAANRPVSLGKRSGGPCEGTLVADGRYEHLVGGRLVAATSVFYDAEKHEACALLKKDRGDESFGRSSYLALTLCNSAGACDSDWFDYPHEAGPVRVQSVDGCVSWRASMQDPGDLSWLVHDAVRQVGC
ncbi:MAG: serine/threonine-protein kinase [Nakamurella sp.]